MQTFLTALGSALLVLCAASGCSKPSRTSKPVDVVPTFGAIPAAIVVDPPEEERTPVESVTPSPAPTNTCETKIDAVRALPGLPGAPRLEAQRVEILMDSKAEPVWFVATPEYGDAEVSPQVERYRKQLLETKYPVDVLTRLLPTFAQAPRMGREVILRGGYLFADDPNLARALVTGVTVEHLFAHDAIWIRRGELLMHAERRRGLYYYTDGPNVGDRVTLLLFDELGHGEVPKRSLARDFRPLRAELFFDHAKVVHATEEHLVAELTYGEVTTAALLRSDGPRVTLDCETVPRNAQPFVDGLRKERARRHELVQHLRATMLDEIAEKLPFDEPRREWGLQLDGKLRQNWRHAYSLGRSSFAFNGDRYYVFDSQGRPLVPQVCVDFLTDTLERASGNWWRPKGAVPGRTAGKLDFDTIPGQLRDELRRVPVFVDYTRKNPDKFEVLDLPNAERIPLGDKARFSAYLVQHLDDYQPGDIVVIRGPTPWDRRQQHYHSFFVYENDPMTGIPIAVVGNAGRPTVRYWRVETQRTPKRTIWHRIRPTTEWLEAIIEPSGSSAPSPPPLSPRGNPG
jgi:hypothetical protein